MAHILAFGEPGHPGIRLGLLRQLVRRVASLVAIAPVAAALGVAWRLIAARAISLTGALIGAWFYGPHDFAVFGFYLAALTIAGLVLFARFEGAIIGIEEEHEANACIRLCCLIGLLVCALTMPLLLLAVIAGVLPPECLPLFVLALAMRGAMRLVLSQSTRLGHFCVLARATLLQSAVQPLVLLMLTRTSLGGPTVLAVADLAGTAAALTAVLTLERRAVVAAFADRVGFADMRAVMRKWASLPLVNLPGALMATAFMALPLLVLPLVADRQTAGFVVIALRILDVPNQLIGSTATPILLHQVTLTRGRAPRHRILVVVAPLLAAVTIIYGLGAVLAVVLAPWLAETKWHGLFALVPILAAFSAGVAASGPLFELASLFREQRPLALINALALAAALVVFVQRPQSIEPILLALAIVSLVRAVSLAWHVAKCLGDQAMDGGCSPTSATHDTTNRYTAILTGRASPAGARFAAGNLRKALWAARVSGPGPATQLATKARSRGGLARVTTRNRLLR